MKNIWKLEFRKLWGIDGDGETWNYPDCSSEQVEIFIESLLAEQKKELVEYVQKEVQERMMKYDSKNGYSNLHDEIMEKVYDDVTDIFNHHE